MLDRKITRAGDAADAAPVQRARSCPVFLLCQVERSAGGACGRRQQAEDGAGEVSFQAAQRFAAALPFSLFAFEVVASGAVDAALGDGDAVERAVELAVAGAVEPVPALLAGGGVERCDPGVHRQLRVAAE